MTLSEFKAWFEGFTEQMDGAPNAKQWKRIQKRVSEINDMPTPAPIFINEHYHPYRDHWHFHPPYTITSLTATAGNQDSAWFGDGGSASLTARTDVVENYTGMMSSAAWQTAGRAEMASIS